MSPIIDMEILDMDKKDNYQELVFVIEGSRYAPSLGIFLHYDKNNLKYLGAINLPWTDNFTTCVDKKSSALKIKEWNNSLGFSSFQEKLYFIQEGKLKEQENISDIRIFDRKVIGIVKKNIEVYKGKDFDELLFTAEEDNLLFVSSNFKSWLKVKSFNTGKIGYIHFQMKESDYGEELYFYKQEDLDGMTFQDIFDNLPFNE
ncbi:MAG: hypothetical protein Q4A58_02570 [Fusobacterium sp.]|uniref:hypothetical protein n=1 Tax=Fusobacterium sp. TaxID=68766 RepID=UPI0026DA7F9D|nr:hypothetical protein [Fusobacterium sp.]MDO4690160.1 hypothetical protein [Fusobacterium sp.]